MVRPFDAATKLKIEQWLKEKNVKTRCPACDGDQYTIEDNLGCLPSGELVSLGPRGMAAGADLSHLFPFVLLLCDNCGYTRLFNSVSMGLVGSPSPGADQ
jgi:hypothetical protein